MLHLVSKSQIWSNWNNATQLNWMISWVSSNTDSVHDLTHQTLWRGLAQLEMTSKAVPGQHGSASLERTPRKCRSSPALCTGLFSQGPGCIGGPWQPCPASLGTTNHSPRTQRLHFSSALDPQPLPELSWICVCLQLCPSQASACPGTLLIPVPWTEIPAWPHTRLLTKDLLGPSHLKQG